MVGSDDYDHPIPEGIANRAALHYSVSRSEFHNLLEAIDEMQNLHNELQMKASRSDYFEILKRSRGITYYRVRRGWVSAATGGATRSQITASGALSQSYDRCVIEKTDAHIGNGQGFVLSSR